ncbi:hypothetical protein CJ030_MR5G016240 [Morella rubra]|uniref:Uncharacterized protein n=1 Tax=Morella rubra TaxID=262757 RepID=A0A6A1VM15_9ROSI|nr:hypothetical protein CJ030_MR5G020282 [Morella rubra]KAB1213655.1 hypothetical protein CJ030_MR5G016240 [Morella rubra]
MRFLYEGDRRWSCIDEQNQRGQFWMVGFVAMRAVGAPMTIKEEEFKGNLSMREVIDSLDKFELEELINNCFEPRRWKNRKIVGTSIEDQNDESNDIQEYFAKELIDRFYEMRRHHVDLKNQWEFKDFVNVEGYMLPRGLAPILKGLFAPNIVMFVGSLN